jgi:glutamyl-tRNA(Gln) amidotransferase subunit E
VEEIRLRWVDAVGGVPNETRKPLLSGLTTFERILPGADRMYPDTDSPPTRVTSERVERLRAQLSPTPWVREKLYREWGVPLETTHFLIRRGGAALVDEVVKRTGASGRLAAIELGQGAKALQRAGIPVDRLGAEEWVQVFDLYTDARIPREAIRPVAAALARNPGLHAEDAAKALGFDLQPPQVWPTRLAGGGASARDVAEYVRTGRRAAGGKA